MTATGWRAWGVSAQPYAAVAAGSMLGGSVRWLASELLHGWLGPAFPWGTLFVNTSGSFLIGWYAAMFLAGGRLAAGPLQRHFMMAGVCGGYTTFSIFSIETIRLLESGESTLAAINVVGSTCGWILAVWAGFSTGSRRDSRPS
jgi:fluoride exporter